MAEGACGAEHPEQPGVFCERVLCVEYHRSGQIIWTQGAQPRPTGKPNTARMNEVVRRTKAKARKDDPQTSHEAATKARDLMDSMIQLGDLDYLWYKTILAVIKSLGQALGMYGVETKGY